MIIRKVGTAVAATAAGLALLMAPQAASAVGEVTVQGNNCFVDISTAPYYDANWHEMGRVGRGQGFYEHGWLGDGWYVGDLWGGAKNVRMHSSAFGPPCGD